VWHALTDAQALGEWFGLKLNGSLSPGVRLQGQVSHKGYEHVRLEIVVERMEPERLFSWHWHPHPVDPTSDYSQESMTLVVFELADDPAGTRLTVVESGFDSIPLTRRMEAYRSNERGWGLQMEALARYVGQAAQSA
jgi:uncharacterized protein YndB with AHSA1/START domain